MREIRDAYHALPPHLCLICFDRLLSNLTPSFGLVLSLDFGSAHGRGSWCDYGYDVDPWPVGPYLRFYLAIWLALTCREAQTVHPHQDCPLFADYLNCSGTF